MSPRACDRARRRAVACLVGVSVLGAIAPRRAVAQPRPSAGGQGLPLRNLVVEVRQRVDDGASEQRAGLSGGQVVVGTGGTTVQGGVEWRAGSREQSTGIVQQVLVLNGGEAGVRVSAQTPWQFVQVFLTAQGPSVLPGVTWIETAAGFRVRPRWAGGDSPAVVELVAEAGSPVNSTAPGAAAGGIGGPAGSGWGVAPPAAGGGAAATAQATVLSTVQVPLGEWVTVARSGREATVDRSGTWSSSSAQRRERLVLEIRVTAP